MAEELEERMQNLMNGLCAEVGNRQAQGTSEILNTVRHCFLQTQREILDLKKEVVDLRLQLERLRHGY